MLFEIEGVPRREKLFKKNRSYIAVYEDRLHIELDGEHDDIDINDVFDVYIKEPIVEDVTSRTTMVEFYEEGELNYYELEDETFPGLSDKVEWLLATGGAPAIGRAFLKKKLSRYREMVYRLLRACLYLLRPKSGNLRKCVYGVGNCGRAAKGTL